MLQLLRDVLAGKPALKRSPKWPALQKLHLKKQPVCQVCGGKKELNAHHKKPFNDYPELELDPNNLITLCNARRCHITFGHGGDFRAWNPNVDQDVIHARQMIASRRYDRLESRGVENMPQ